MQAKYVAAIGSPLSNLEARLLGREFERLQLKNGKLTPEILVAEAKANRRSPLRAYFTWNVEEAAAERWLDQARSLLRSVHVIVTDGGSKEPMRAFVRVKTEKGRSYEPLMKAMSDDDLRRQILEQALEDLRRFENRYRRFTELAEVFTALRVVKRKLKKVKRAA